ncbi:Protein of unknown function (DUF2605) [Leptolyngbyaceae cyanobacterium JSC-12]|nr:Protein of unknown function (DUF2605) [Leptolyngbyaceae cyanobacterium JSC-12]
MSFSNSADPELLKSILEPLLEDFQYWFGRSLTFLESNELSFMTTEQQADLLARVVRAKQEVAAAQSLFRVTGGQVGVEISALTPWHHLVSECWQVVNRFRRESATRTTDGND